MLSAGRVGRKSLLIDFPAFFKEYKVEVILKENWNDPRLAYGNASWYVRLKGATLAKVWYPDTMIENSRKHEVDDKTRTAYLFGDGTIFLSEWYVWITILDSTVMTYLTMTTRSSRQSSV